MLKAITTVNAMSQLARLLLDMKKIGEAEEVNKRKNDGRIRKPNPVFAQNEP